VAAVEAYQRALRIAHEEDIVTRFTLQAVDRLTVLARTQYRPLTEALPTGPWMNDGFQRSPLSELARPVVVVNTPKGAKPTGRPEVPGGLNKETIRETVHQHSGEIRACYEQELRTDPNLAGRVVVKITVARDGAVSEANVTENTLSSEAVGDCITKRILTWTFPKPKGAVVIVNYPFNFNTK